MWWLMDTHEEPDHWGRSEGVHSAGERCSESLEMGGQALWGEAENLKDFMTVLMFGLGLEGCMPGKRSGDQEGKQQKQRPRDVQ